MGCTHPSKTLLLLRFLLITLAILTSATTIPRAWCLQTCYWRQQSQAGQTSRAFTITSPSLVIHRHRSWTTTTETIGMRVGRPSQRSRQLPSKGNDHDHDDDNKMSSQQSSKLPLVDQLVTAVGSTTSIVVAGTFYAFLCYRRDSMMVNFFIGAISNGILSKVLKRAFKVERPTGLDVSTMDVIPSDHGMPSSHAMSLGFIGTFTALQLPWTALPLLSYSAVSLVYRVRSKLHTLDQIIVGAVVGSLNGAIWWSLCLGRNPYGICINDWVDSHVLDAAAGGVLPLPLLVVPAIVGAAVVGSVERRLAKLFRTIPSTDDDGSAAENKQD